MLREPIVLPKANEVRPKPYGRRDRWSPTMGLAAVYEPDGSLAFQETEWTQNALTNSGEQNFLQVYLSGTANPSKYLCLINGSTTPPTITSTATYLGGSTGAGETQTPGSNGYNRIQVATTDWGDDGVVGGYERFSAAQKTFGPASATWTITHAGLVTTATGTGGVLILWLALSASTTVASSQSFSYLLRAQLQ